jgi:hypothetical protein
MLYSNSVGKRKTQLLKHIRTSTHILCIYGVFECVCNVYICGVCVCVCMYKEGGV